MDLSDAQVRRYARHILLPDVGGVGQKRLLAATVAVELPETGAGDALCAIAYLAAAGVGTIALAGASNQPVSRQDITAGILLGEPDLDRTRADAIHARVATLNPDVRIVEGAPANAPWLPRIPEPGGAALPAAVDAVSGALFRGGQAACAVLTALLAPGTRD